MADSPNTKIGRERVHPADGKAHIPQGATIVQMEMVMGYIYVYWSRPLTAEEMKPNDDAKV